MHTDDGPPGSDPIRPPASPRRAWAAAMAMILAVGAVLALTAGGGLVAWLVLGSDSRDAGAQGTQHGAALGEGFAVFERNHDGQPVRWDPCTPVPLVVDPRHAPPDFIDDLEEAIERLEGASGLRFDVEGTTAERPTGTRPPYQPERYGDRWAPVLVAWAAPGEAGLPLRDIDRGVALPVAVGVPGDRGYVTGQVVFNRERDDLVAGFGDRSDAWGATIVHELAHLLGLDHVDDTNELMSTYPGSGAVGFGPGDRAGLRAVGGDGSCRTAPTARPITPDRGGEPTGRPRH